jgi:autophagy-related protein 13
VQFNLELPETDLFKSELRTWRSVSTQPSTPPMILTLILDTSDLTANQVLVLSSAGRRIRVGEKGGRGRSHVVLEEWTLALGDPDPESSTKGMELPTVYKQSIMFFRSLYTTLHSLPAASLTKRLGRGRGGAGIKIGLRMSMGADDAGKEGFIGMGERVGEEELGTVEESVDWATVDTPLG